MEFMSTNLPHNISHGLYHDLSYDVADIHVEKLFYTLMFGASAILNDIKSKEAPSVLLINTIKAKTVAAAIVEYFDNGDKPGNWSLRWTFDPEDIPETTATKMDLLNPHTQSYFRTVAGEKYKMGFHDSTAIVVLLTYCIEQLYKWLDENAKEGETVEIDLDGIFNAKVEIVDGVKVFALDPAGEVKTIIKDDASIEK